MIIMRLAVAALAVTLLAGCAARAAPAASKLSPSPPTTPAATPVATPAATLGPPLSIRQAGRLFARIMDPLDRAIGTFHADAADQVPFSQFQADGHALIAVVRDSEGELTAAHWPAQV